MNDIRESIRRIARLVTEEPCIYTEAAEPKSKPKVKPATKTQRGFKVEAKKDSGVKSKPAPKPKKNKPTEEIFGKEFRAMLGLDDKSEPGDPSKNVAPDPLTDADGAKQTGSAYLK